MKLHDAILKRRSVREFKDKKIDWRDVLDCLESTKYAPMAGGYYSLKFLLIDDKKQIDKVAEWASQDWIKSAKYLVFFVSDPSITKNQYKERAERYLHQQAGAAIQNFMLTMTEKKISTCWIGHYNDEKLKEIFQISGSSTIEAIIALGYEKEKPKTRKILPDLYNRISFHTWGNKRINPPSHAEHYAPTGYSHSTKEF